MKTTLVALTAIAALTFTPRPAHALGDKEAALLGGLIGGAIIGAAINDAFDDGQVTLHYSSYGRGHHRHGYHRGSSCGPRYGHGHGYHHPRGGYWSYRTVKVWVPGRTWFTYDPCGRRVKHFQRGYWTHRKEKVWVERRGRW